MQTVQIKRNTGVAIEVDRHQLITVTAQTIVDVVLFNRHDLTERFDQARTKANEGTIFVTTGNILMSRANNYMATIVDDTFEGHHDLQEGMCSRRRHELALERGIWEKTYNRPLSEMPTHGCTENLSAVLAPYGIAPEDIPSPLNLFQHMDIDSETGAMTHSTFRPGPSGASVTLRTEMDLLVGLSSCPDVVSGDSGVTVRIAPPDDDDRAGQQR